MIHRPERVADAVKDAVARIVLNELADPKLGFVTVTRARVSRDLKIATICISVLGDRAEQEAGLARIKHAGGFIRRRLGEHIKLRYLPELRFRLDDVLDQERNVDRVLKELYPEPPDQENDSSAPSSEDD